MCFSKLMSPLIAKRTVFESSLAAGVFLGEEHFKVLIMFGLLKIPLAVFSRSSQALPLKLLKGAGRSITDFLEEAPRQGNPHGLDYGSC